MKKSSRLLKSEYCHHCSSHSFHLLIMCDSINKIPELRELIVRCKEIVTKLHYKGDVIENEVRKLQCVNEVGEISKKVASAFEILTSESEMPLALADIYNDCENVDDCSDASMSHEPEICAYDARGCGKSYKRLRQEVVTRWNSAHEMLSSLVSLEEYVNEALKVTGNFALCIKPSEWIVINQLCTVLQPFKELTEVASNSFVGLSVVPLIRAKVNTACLSSPSDCEEIALLKTKILSNLDRRFPLTDTVKLASLLDPASKNKKYLGMTFEEKQQLLLLQLNAVSASGAPLPETGDVAPLRVRDFSACENDSKRLKLMSEYEDELCDDDLLTSVTQYLTSPKKPSDPTAYWRGSKFTCLATLARKYLGINASSVPVEAMFSVTYPAMEPMEPRLPPLLPAAKIFLP